MSASMESIIAAALSAHWKFSTDTTQDPFVDRCDGCGEVVYTHGTQLKHALATHQARAVLAAISEAGAVEWGVTWPGALSDPMQAVSLAAAKNGAEGIAKITSDGAEPYAVSRITGPWTAVE